MHQASCSFTYWLFEVTSACTHTQNQKINYSLICTTIRVVFLNKRCQNPSISKYIHKKIPTPSQRRPLCGREKSWRFHPNQQFLDLSLTLNSSDLRVLTYIVLNQWFKKFTNQRLRRSLESALFTYNAYRLLTAYFRCHLTRLLNCHLVVT